jgi:hypothetical protein
MDEYTPAVTRKDGLLRPGGWPITPSGDEPLNETVYLFALSVPDLLEQIIAGQAGPRIPAAVPARTEKRA